MLRSLLPSRLSRTTGIARSTSARRGVESVPPSSSQRSWPSRLGEWLMASGWREGAGEPSAFAARARREALDAAKVDFAEALRDIATDGAADALDRIDETQQLDELWHLRGEVFGRVAERHGQREAERRLAAIDRHFALRARRASRRGARARR